ncbi:MAG: kelch repeat-containing protein [Planctomycetota bacterium]
MMLTLPSARALWLFCTFSLVVAAALPAQGADLRWDSRSDWPSRVIAGPTYDVVRGRIMVLDDLGRTQQWDGARWSASLATPTGLLATQEAMAFDSKRGCAVLQAGSETWEWDGQRWSLRGALSVRLFGAALAFDERRGVVVLYGNDSSVGVTAEWDGASWRRRSPAVSPPPLRYHRMAYDAARSQVVLFGGTPVSGGALSADTWLWDGTNWRLATPARSPAARLGPALSESTVPGRVLLFGGTTDTGAADDTWEWDGTQWIERRPAQRPSGSPVGMVLDRQRGRVVMLLRGANDLWVWDGANWTSLPGRAPAPAPQVEQLIADPVRRRLVTHGGVDPISGVVLGSTWEWDGTVWREHTGPGPGPRTGHAMTYDPVRGGVLLHGGVPTITGSPASSARDDVWLWDGVSWRQLAPSGFPAWQHGMAFDERRQRVVLLAGDETIEWDGSVWTSLRPSPRPQPRGRPGMAYDPVRGRMVMTGYFRTSLSYWTADVWEWDGTAWAERWSLSSFPGLAPSGDLTFHPDLGRVVAWHSAWDGSRWLPLLAPSPTSGFPRPALVPQAIAFDYARGVLAGLDSDGGSMVLSQAAARPYGAGCRTGAGLVPDLTGYGLPSLGNSAFALDLSAVPNIGVVHLLGASSGRLALPGGCTLLLDPAAPLAAIPQVTNGFGWASLPLPIPDRLWLVRQFLHAQSVVLDTGLGAGYAMSNGLSLEFDH